jgi:arginine:ornithine antiporter/lysine permease
MCAEVLYTAARTKDMPRVFGTENKNGVPSTALWLTNIVVQLFVISTLFSQDAFSLMLELTSAMSLIPYLFVAGYGLLIAKRGETYESRPEHRKRDLTLAAIAVLYTAFMIFAGGMKFIVLSAALYAPGTALYFWARREQSKQVFTIPERIIFVVAIIGALAGVVGLVSGRIPL